MSCASVVRRKCPKLLLFLSVQSYAHIHVCCFLPLVHSQRSSSRVHRVYIRIVSSLLTKVLRSRSSERLRILRIIEVWLLLTELIICSKLLISSKLVRILRLIRLSLNIWLSLLSVIERLLCGNRWIDRCLYRNLRLRNKRGLNNWLRRQSGSLYLRYWSTIKRKRNRSRLCWFGCLSAKNIKLNYTILFSFRLVCLRFRSRLLSYQRFFFFSWLRQLACNLFKRLLGLDFDGSSSFFLLLFGFVAWPDCRRLIIFRVFVFIKSRFSIRVVSKIA